MTAPNSLPAALRLCRLACQHYGLSDEATAMALFSAERNPDRAVTCYRALLGSVVTERVRYAVGKSSGTAHEPQEKK